MGYFSSLQHPAMEYGEVCSVVALKRDEGAHTLRGSPTMSPIEMRTTGVFPLSGQGRWIGKRLSDFDQEAADDLPSVFTSRLREVDPSVTRSMRTEVVGRVGPQRLL